MPIAARNKSGFTHAPICNNIEQQCAENLCRRCLLQKKFRSKKLVSGFTLVEVLVASALLIFAMVPILKAITQIHTNTVIIERRTKSLNFAKSQINQLQAKSIYNFDNILSQSDLALDNLYLCNISSSSVNTNLKKIVVSVGMDRNQNGTLGSDEVEVTLQTQIARR